MRARLEPSIRYTTRPIMSVNHDFPGRAIPGDSCPPCEDQRYAASSVPSAAGQRHAATLFVTSLMKHFGDSRIEVLKLDAEGKMHVIKQNGRHAVKCQKPKGQIYPILLLFGQQPTCEEVKSEVSSLPQNSKIAWAYSIFIFNLRLNRLPRILLRQ